MLAVNVGLLAQHLAARLLSGIDEPPEHVLKAGHVSQANLIATGLGQMDDLLNQAGRSAALEDIRRMYMLKSSYYTFVNPLQTGAALAGVSEDELRPLKEFGLHAGVAFQLQDDIIGMFGDARQTGKSSLDDLREGKLTMLMQHALEHADPKELQIIRRGLGNERVTVEQHQDIQKLLEHLGSRAYVRKEAQKEVAAALGVLRAQPSWQPGAAAFLTDLLQYTVGREN
jgi:geranylgeranyl diphosphate synthase type I